MKTRRFGFWFVVAICAWASQSAQATCMMTCSDSDKGNTPQVKGRVTVTTRCSPPGGPVDTKVLKYDDVCKSGKHTEYFCDTSAMPGTQGMKKQDYRCKSCNRLRGTCARPTPIPGPTDGAVIEGPGIDIDAEVPPDAPMTR